MLKIISLESVDSTHKYIKEHLKNKTLMPPCAVVADIQTAGMGSRDNSWDSLEGNFFLSFAIEIKRLPKDLRLESASIYFAYLLKDVLAEFGSSVWLKWPNDFYIKDMKIGGMITNVMGGIVVCGVGINISKAPDMFGVLDIKISKQILLQKYLQKIKKNILWKQVFSKYKLEFYTNHKFFTHNNNQKISLSDAVLQEDGSILCGSERIYSRR